MDDTGAEWRGQAKAVEDTLRNRAERKAAKLFSKPEEVSARKLFVRLHNMSTELPAATRRRIRSAKISVWPCAG
jgi:hypothetical protein